MFRLLALIVFSFNFSILADEGMWLYSHLPLKQIEAKYGVKLSPSWIEHVMKSSVRVGSGGSGSFISSDGRILTNHHVAAQSLAKISKPGGINYYQESFVAHKLEDEVKLPDLEINALTEIQDVTEKVLSAVKPGMSEAEASAARKVVIAELEAVPAGVKDRKNQVVTLYQGGRFHLYRYKVYTDIRLVFTPGFDIGFFGGDFDNFNFPRWCLDMTIFRAYEDGKPAKIEHYLKIADKGAKEGDVVFVSGHPGRTGRLLTLAATQFQRDVRFKYAREIIALLEVTYQQYQLRGKEQKRQASDLLFSIQNSRKATLGRIQALQDPDFFAKKYAEETDLRMKVRADEKLRHLDQAWDKIAGAQAAAAPIYERYALLENGVTRGPDAFNSKLFRIARTLVRMAEEDAKKDNGKRLAEFQTANRPTLELALFSTAPIYPELEQATLADSLGTLQQRLGFNDPLVQTIMMGKTASERATELVYGSKLISVENRRLIASQKLLGIQSSQDPMILLAIAVDRASRAVRKAYEERVDEVEKQAYAQIAEASKHLLDAGESNEPFETKVYPDATFTLRLSYGQVKGYRSAGKEISPLTDIGGAFLHEADHDSQYPFKLPKEWQDAKAKLNLSTPFNVATTNDVIGGNSGSPLINVDGELTGLIFDGNIESLAGEFYYEGETNRTISVHIDGMKEALDKVYGAAHVFAP